MARQPDYQKLAFLQDLISKNPHLSKAEYARRLRAEFEGTPKSTSEYYVTKAFDEIRAQHAKDKNYNRHKYMMMVIAGIQECMECHLEDKSQGKPTASWMAQYWTGMKRYAEFAGMDEPEKDEVSLESYTPRELREELVHLLAKANARGDRSIMDLVEEGTPQLLEAMAPEEEEELDAWEEKGEKMDAAEEAGEEYDGS